MLKGFIDGIIGLVKLFGSKPSFLTVITTVLSVIPGLVKSVVDLKATDAKEKVDEFLDALDGYTGTDAGAVRVFPHMPPEREEEFWDAIKMAARNYAYEELKVPGYYQP